VSIPKTISILTALACAFIMLNASNVCAQFAGSVILSGYRSTNVEGRDSSTPDNVFNPSIDLLYNWEISNPTAIKFEATVTPNIYQGVKSRSYLKTYFGATGYFYLSDLDDTPKPTSLPVPPSAILPPHTKTNAPQPDAAKPVIIVKPAHADIPQIASVKLAALSELLDSLEIGKKGLSADSINIASDLKDSVSESVLALSDILATQVFTESIADVVTNEIANQKKIFSQVPMDASHKAEIGKGFDDILELMKGGKPQSDILPTPKPNVTVETPTPISESSAPTRTNDLLDQALAHLQSAEDETSVTRGENAPIITLINSQTEFKDLSSQDILLKEDLLPLTKKTLATLLSVPVSLEIQNNKGAYISYSYSEFELKPRLDLYFGKTFGMGATYDLSITKFPNDTTHLNDGTENKFRLDSRIEVTPGFVLVPEFGLGFKSYDRSIQYSTIVPVKGRPFRPDTVKVTTPTNYRRMFFGGTFIIFPISNFSVGVAEAMTRSSNIRPYLFDSLLTQKSRIGGTITDDEYSYELTRESIFFLWSIFWDIHLSLDVSYENRHYANVEIKKKFQRLPTTNIQRDDHGPLFGLNLSKEFLFDSRLISIFSSFTPSIDVQSTNYTSTVSQFNYKDVTTTLSLEFGF